MLNSYPYTVWIRIIVYLHVSLHVLLTVVCFTAIRPLVPLLTVVYSPDVGEKGTSHTKPSPTLRTAVGFLSLVYTPYV